MLTLSPERWQKVSPYLDQVLSLPGIERRRWLESLGAEKAELADLLQEQFRCLPQVDSSMVYGRTHV